MPRITKPKITDYSGLILIAINPCIMEDGECTLTVNNRYAVRENDMESIVIKDDNGDLHHFPYEDIYKFFKDLDIS